MSYFKFILYYIMKKKDTKNLDEEMVMLLEKNNYTPYKEWKEDVQDISDNNPHDSQDN